MVTVEFLIYLQIEQSDNFQFLHILERGTVVNALVDDECTSPARKNQQSVAKTLCLHHCILTVKAELDQLCKGLSTMGVLDAIRRYPKIFARYFVSEERKSLTFGLEPYCVYVI